MIHVCIFVFISVFRFAYLSSVLLFAATVDPLLLRDKSDHHLCDNCHLHDHPHNYNQIITLIIIPDNCYHPEYPCKHVEMPLAPVVNITKWASFRPVPNDVQFHIFYQRGKF